MKAAVVAYDATFEPFPDSYFDAEYVGNYEYTERQAPFAVIGDMNGDHVTDVIVLGHGKHDALLAILSEGKKFRVVELEKVWGPDAYLRLQERGRVEWHDALEPAPLTLETDAYIVGIADKAATVYYWRNGKFEQYAIGD
jgi:hypothetical protein